ncbi:hypothetical protein DFJ73DRAFT_840465 [Zopfochytrium polystomum]|nr:hypothetical protein DFJ73DRAFT_840465 [Zopfochytrium polystomum]
MSGLTNSLAHAAAPDSITSIPSSTLLSCRCLNVRINCSQSRTGGAPTSPPATEAVSAIPGFGPPAIVTTASLALPGITIAHTVLVRSSSYPSGFATVQCLGCNLACYALAMESPASADVVQLKSTPLAPSDGSGVIFVSSLLLSGEKAVQAAMLDPSYSSVYKIIIASPSPSPAADSSSPLLAQLQDLLSAWTNRETAQTEERIRRYKAEQMQLLEASVARARSDRDRLWTLIARVADPDHLLPSNVSIDPAQISFSSAPNMAAFSFMLKTSIPDRLETMPSTETLASAASHSNSTASSSESIGPTASSKLYGDTVPSVADAKADASPELVTAVASSHPKRVHFAEPVPAPPKGSTPFQETADWATRGASSEAEDMFDLDENIIDKPIQKYGGDVVVLDDETPVAESERSAEPQYLSTSVPISVPLLKRPAVAGSTAATALLVPADVPMVDDDDDVGKSGEAADGNGRSGAGGSALLGLSPGFVAPHIIVARSFHDETFGRPSPRKASVAM